MKTTLGVIASVATAVEHENKYQTVKSISSTLYKLLAPEQLVASEIPRQHENLNKTVMVFERMMAGRIQDVQKEIKDLEQSAPDKVKSLGEELTVLTDLNSILAEIKDINSKSALDIQKIEKILQRILKVENSLLLSKAGDQLSQFVILLVGLAGVPAFGASLVFPAGKKLATMITKKYFENARQKAEAKGLGVIENSHSSLQDLSLAFLESKDNPWKDSPGQEKYLDLLKKYIAVEGDANRIFSAINDYDMLNNEYVAKESPAAVIRAQLIIGQLKDLEAELRQPHLAKLADQSSYSSESSADGLRRQVVIAKIALLKQELVVLQPIVEKNGISSPAHSKSPTEQDAERQQFLAKSLREDKVEARTLYRGLKISNMAAAQEAGLSLGGVVSPKSSQEGPSRLVESMSPSGTAPGRSFAEMLAAASLNPEPASSSSSSSPQTHNKQEPVSPKPSVDDKSAENKSTLSDHVKASAITQIDAYVKAHANIDSSGKLSAKGDLRFSGAEQLLKARAGLVIKSLFEGQPTHKELLANLEAEKQKYSENHAHSEKSPFVKMVDGIAAMVKADQTAQAQPAAKFGL